MKKKNIGRVPNVRQADYFLFELNNASETNNSNSTGTYFEIYEENRIHDVQQELFKVSTCIDS